MAEIETSLQSESRERYLTYALSVVTGRALPDVRDGLKPVQRRILYAMYRNLGLRPDRPFRKSAAVIGEVLARYHPHGDSACYEAMVRMAQDFSMRNPLVEGQGNFGSLDGDPPAAYRYTEARLRKIALELIGEIEQDTVGFRDNFDSTTSEPVVLPSRFPNLLVNGASGIAVGMATNIPPHNLRDVVKALLALSENSEISNSRLTTLVKGPDFPTGCVILNSKKELEEIYRSGRGSVKMRGRWQIEESGRGKRFVVIESIPYAVNKSQLVEKIAACIIDRKVPQLVDVRDESTEEVRVVLELAQGANPDLALAYLYKHTPLESNFQVNLTALVPGENDILKPVLLSLKECLQYFLDFRRGIVESCLRFEQTNLEKRLHLLEGFMAIFDHLDEALDIVRSSTGRGDAAKKLRGRFDLSEVQSLAIVDLRVYHLSKTNISELRKEHKENRTRLKEIKIILGDEEALMNLVREDLELVSREFGERRLCSIQEDEGIELRREDFLVAEDVYAIVTREGWIKRIRQQNDLSSTRVREGDEIRWAHIVSTLQEVAFITSAGSLYTLGVDAFPSSSGFGTPVQKLLKFRDGEKIVASFVVSAEDSKGGATEEVQASDSLLYLSRQGQASITQVGDLSSIKRSGRRLARLRDPDELVAALSIDKEFVVATAKGYLLRVKTDEIPEREGPSLGVAAIDLDVKKRDYVVGAVSVSRGAKIVVELESGREKSLALGDLKLSKRALRGERVVKGGNIVRIRVGG